MGIKFILMVNKQGQTRLASYYDWLTIDERSALEAEIIRKCLSRTEMQCSFMEYRGMKVVYRRYASLFFIVGVEQDEEVGLAVYVCYKYDATYRLAASLVAARAIPASAVAERARYPRIYSRACRDTRQVLRERMRARHYV